MCINRPDSVLEETAQEHAFQEVRIIGEHLRPFTVSHSSLELVKTSTIAPLVQDSDHKCSP